MKHTNRSTPKRYDRHRAEDTEKPGRGKASGSCGHIHFAPNARRKEDTSRQRSLTTSFRTVEMRSSSGMSPIGCHSVSGVMTGRPGQRTATRSITIDRPPRGGVKSLYLSAGRPTAPQTRKSAKLKGWGPYNSKNYRFSHKFVNFISSDEQFHRCFFRVISCRMPRVSGCFVSGRNLCKSNTKTST